jgi:hypothetical protein
VLQNRYGLGEKSLRTTLQRLELGLHISVGSDPDEQNIGSSGLGFSSQNDFSENDVSGD